MTIIFLFKLFATKRRYPFPLMPLSNRRALRDLQTRNNRIIGTSKEYLDLLQKNVRLRFTGVYYSVSYRTCEEVWLTYPWYSFICILPVVFRTSLGFLRPFRFFHYLAQQTFLRSLTSADLQRYLLNYLIVYQLNKQRVLQNSGSALLALLLRKTH